MGAIINKLYPFRHILALCGAVLGWYCIQVIARVIFMGVDANMGFVTMTQVFWQTGDWFFRLLVIFNNVVKPIVIYGLIWFVFDLQNTSQ